MNEIVFSCGYCGAPCDASGKQLDSIPEGYNPDNYKHDVCIPCGNEQSAQENKQCVTREMALDAGDPSLEGIPY